MFFLFLVLSCRTEDSVFSYKAFVPPKANIDSPLEDSASPLDTGVLPEDTDTQSGCYTGNVTAQIFDAVDVFSQTLNSTTLTVNFDDVDTSGEDPVAIEADRYFDSHGILIVGEGGQFVDDEFEWTDDYISVSSPNMFAPGPAVLEGGGYNTEVSFAGCVSGFGAFFIDADFPELGPSSLQAENDKGEAIYTSTEIFSESGSSMFHGVVMVDDDGNIQPAISQVNLVNGSVWPMSSCCDGVTLDNFVFSPPQ